MTPSTIHPGSHQPNVAPPRHSSVASPLVGDEKTNHANQSQPVGPGCPTSLDVGYGFARPTTVIQSIIILTLFTTHLSANTPDPQQTLANALTQFDNATELMRTDPDKAQTAFNNAAREFQSLIDNGHRNTHLYYNLANTHLRLGQLGPAIANYRRALKINPANERAKANLNFTRTLTRDQFKTTGTHALKQTLLFWHYNTTAQSRRNFAIILYASFWLILATKTIRPKTRITYPATITGLVTLALAISLSISIPNQSRLTGGVITANQVTVRKGNGQSYAPQFDQPLHEGTEFAILEQRSNWLHIQLPDNNTGWIQSKHTELF